MKKFVKGCLLVAGGLCVVGLLMVCVCAAMGGGELFVRAMENNEFSIGDMGYRMNSVTVHPDSVTVHPFDQDGQNDDWMFDEESDDQDWDKDDDYDNDWDDDDYDTHEFFNTTEKTAVASKDDIQVIDLKVGAAQLKVGQSEDDQYWFQCNEGKIVQCYVKDDNTLVIRGVNKIGNHNVKIYLYVPADVRLDFVNIELGAGQIRMDGIQSGVLDAAVGAGQAKFTGMDVNDISLEVGAGEVDYAGTVQGDIDVDCAMGQVKMNLYSREQDWNYDISCAAGQIQLSDMVYDNLFNDAKIDNNAMWDCDLECTMGQIAVTFQQGA
ncbi:MAG: DUF4097 family beta strand repeat-containing protein [Lachnospiraceae bacterium]|nr:DUF4097 family beta strand repeat-containing protein [Lachnospiraceae bacterium]